MQLDEFVKTTLAQIVTGIREAQKEVAMHGGAVNPGVDRVPTSQLVREIDGQFTLLRDVEFDVALTVTESDRSGAGLRVGIAWVGGNVEGGSNRQHSEVSRIKFVVPVAFPRQS